MKKNLIFFILLTTSAFQIQSGCFDSTASAQHEKPVFAVDIFPFGLKPVHIISETMEVGYPLSYSRSFGFDASYISHNLKYNWQKLFVGGAFRWQFMKSMGWFLEPQLKLGWSKDFDKNFFTIGGELMLGHVWKIDFMRFAVALGPQYEYRFQDSKNYIFASQAHANNAKRTKKMSIYTLPYSGYVSLGFQF